MKAMEVAKKSAKPSNLLRMAAAFNLSVFYFEICYDVKKAAGLAREVSTNELHFKDYCSAM